MNGPDGRDIALSSVGFCSSHDDGSPMGEGFNGGRECGVSMFSAKRFIRVADLRSVAAS